LSDWVGDVRDRSTRCATAVCSEICVGIVGAAADIGGVAREVCVGRGCTTTGGIISSRGWCGGRRLRRGIGNSGRCGSRISVGIRVGVRVGRLTEKGDALTALACLARGTEDGSVEAIDAFKNDVGVGVSKAENVGVQADICGNSENT